MEVLQKATQHLEASGVESPRLDAEVLLGHVLALERIHLYVQHDRPLVKAELDAYRTCIARRARREPTAYIVGEREFRSLALKVDSRVLIPRPETELLVDEAVAELTARCDAGEGPLTVADVGTGSGAIAIGLAKELANVRIVAIDLSEGALAVAKENAQRHGVAERIEFRHGDLLSPLAGKTVCGIVSNPPYVASPQWPELQPEVRYEPKEALLGGREGLDVVQRLLAQVPNVLMDGGFLLIEIGADQGDKVAGLAEQHGYASCRIVKDLAGKDRIAALTWGEAAR